MKSKLVYIVGLNVVFFVGNALWSFHNNKSQDVDVVIDAFSHVSPRADMLNKSAVVKMPVFITAVVPIDKAEKEKKW